MHPKSSCGVPADKRCPSALSRNVRRRRGASMHGVLLRLHNFEKLALANPVRAVLVHRWVLWWFYLGVVFGAVALSNILFGNLTRTDEHILLIVGAIHWILGGLVCWALEGIRVERPAQRHMGNPGVGAGDKREWHAASEFVFPGATHPLLPPSRRQQRREMVEIYRAEHPEK